MLFCHQGVQRVRAFFHRDGIRGAVLFLVSLNRLEQHGRLLVRYLPKRRSVSLGVIDDFATAIPQNFECNLRVIAL